SYFDGRSFERPVLEPRHEILVAARQPGWNTTPEPALEDPVAHAGGTVIKHAARGSPELRLHRPVPHEVPGDSGHRLGPLSLQSPAILPEPTHVELGETVGGVAHVHVVKLIAAGAHHETTEATTGRRAEQLFIHRLPRTHRRVRAHSTDRQQPAIER